MKRIPSLVALAAIATLTACRPPVSEAPEGPKAPAVPENLVDLSHPFGPDTIYWPTDTQGFGLDVLSAEVTEKGYYYAANRFSTAEHGGTHIDAPIHFYYDRSTVDEIPLKRLIAPGVVIDVREKVQDDHDYLVSIDDFKAWEASHGELTEGVIVLLNTGYSALWDDRTSYLGTDLTGPEAVPELHFPGLDPEAANWLTTERQVAAVGIDTASIDHGQSTYFESHVTLFDADVPAFENVANLDRLPEKDFLVAALPMKIKNGSGGPLRIVAMW